MKIEVRHRPHDSKQPKITIREKTVYICKHCRNHYYAYHFFCPQCMGPVESSARQSCALRIASCPQDMDEIEALLRKLSGVGEFDFRTGLKALPWICMKQSDPTILKIWKECLEGSGVRSEILVSIPASKAKKRKEKAPLFTQDAPYPQLLPAALALEMRSLANALTSPTLKLRYAETAMNAMHLLERLHKNQSERVLFADFAYRIEEHLRDLASRFSTPKFAEPAFEKELDRLSEILRRMESEMDAVREQIQNQL